MSAFGGIDALEVAERIEMHGAGFGGIDPTGAQLRRCQGPRPLGGATSSFTATAGRIRGAASAGCVILPLDIRRRIAGSGDTTLEVTR
jgi:hypothetical protein